MKRDIIQIDEDKCNGCGLCIQGCHEGALALVDGKARLVSEAYCDGLGACLPECPTGAISIVSRDAAAFDEAAVQAHQQPHTHPAAPEPLACGCPGTQARAMGRSARAAAPVTARQPDQAAAEEALSELAQWPVQIKLVPVGAPYLDGARLLIAADCAAYAHAAFHQTFMRGRVTLIGCPKLDGVDYAGKLGDILRHHSIKSILVVRMEVPCCGGLEHAVRQALLTCGKMIPWQVVTLSTDGRILEE
jgi:Pyruvate/2-oxoacid:ferredoxin oxidoreductase delta subunit